MKAIDVLREVADVLQKQNIFEAPEQCRRDGGTTLQGRVWMVLNQPSPARHDIDPVEVVRIAIDAIPNTLEGVMAKRRVAAALRHYFQTTE